MANLAPDSRRIAFWRSLRRKIHLAAGLERHRLLRGFSDEIRFIASIAEKASGEGCKIGRGLELADALAVVTGGLMLVDPYNPGWPGRDRLIVGDPEYLVAVCSALTIMGFFSPEHVARLVAAIERGEDPEIPGLEYIPEAGGMTTLSAWDEAVASKNVKTGWRGGPDSPLLRDWAEPSWNLSPALWRTYVIIRAGSVEAGHCRMIPGTASDTPAGLSILVVTPSREAAELAALWRETGWDASAVGSGDRLRLYDALAADTSEKPQAIMVGVGASAIAGAPGNPDGEARLLGELSDEQFNSLMGEFFGTMT